MEIKLGLESLEEFLDEMEKNADNIRRCLEACNDIDAEFVVHNSSGSVEESVENTGITASQVVKTLVFVGESAFAVLCPGDRMVSESKLEKLTGTDIEMADPSTVKEETGYIVGGVSPFDLDIPVYADRKILEAEEVKPSAGSRCAGVIIDPEDLVEAVDAEVVDVAED